MGAEDGRHEGFVFLFLALFVGRFVSVCGDCNFLEYFETL